MKGYKGFDKELKCYGGYQYKIGRTETTDVDGERIKADTWYTLRDGEFVEVDET